MSLIDASRWATSRKPLFGCGSCRRGLFHDDPEDPMMVTVECRCGAYNTTAP
jgi:hypothetical protein